MALAAAFPQAPSAPGPRSSAACPERARAVTVRAGRERGPSGHRAAGGQRRSRGQVPQAGSPGAVGGTQDRGWAEQGRGSRRGGAGGGTGAAPGGTGARGRRPAWARPRGCRGGSRPVSAPVAGEGKAPGAGPRSGARRACGSCGGGGGVRGAGAVQGSECGERPRLSHRRAPSPSRPVAQCPRQCNTHGQTWELGKYRPGPQDRDAVSWKGVVVASCHPKPTQELPQQNI